MELLKQQIEALIFCSEQSISIDMIAASLKLSFDWEISDEEIIQAIEEIKNKYVSDDFSFELVEISEGYQFLTKKQYYPVVSALIQHKAKKKLSVSQMETLAIIAYRQPISKAEVEHIRGVSCDYSMQKLLEKELIEISGKSDGPGRPILYSTSRSFMDYFAIKSVKDLPQLKDLHVEQNEVGSAVEMEDNGSNENEELITHEDFTELAVADEIEISETISNIDSVVDENLVKNETEAETPTVYDEISNSVAADGSTPDEPLMKSELPIAENVNSEIESISSDEDSQELPDRKAIYLENQENPSSVEKEEEESGEFPESK
jgi:segregation and condensation protein B